MRTHFKVDAESVGRSVLLFGISVDEVRHRCDGRLSRMRLSMDVVRRGVAAVVIEAGVVAGYVIAWVLRKARRVAGRLDAEFDATVDAGLDRLHDVVAAKLGADPALADLADEVGAGDGAVSEVTRQRVELSITAAANKDEAFGKVIADLVAELRGAQERAGMSVLAGGDVRVLTGGGHAQADRGGIAFGQVGGDVRLARGRELEDPSQPGRSSP
ncbi:chromosome partitioning protein [Dactylosporangium sp. CA-139066]|uniref:chromosome partitioning protein n=1 Tax=Dactylosporangium sp. CA-139066 TaxID=3239930 RepID=UPI003D8BF2E9